MPKALETILTPADFAASQECLKDRVILITGAGNGLGRNVARELSRCGATTILLGKTVANLEKTYDLIIESGAPEPAIYPMNLEGASADDFDELAASIEREYGRLDGLLHNAAMISALSPLAQHATESWFRTLHVNLTAPFLMTKALMPQIAKSTSGSIVFTTDRSSRPHNAFWGAYGTSKSGVETMAQTFAEETADDANWRINVIDPGLRDTATRRRLYPAQSKAETCDRFLTDLTGYVYLFHPASNKQNGKLLACQL